MEAELKQYGLSEKEIEIYLAGLKAGSCTANRLSELTGIRRSTVYEVTETLKKKGLMSSIKQEKKYYFVASKPESLIELLKEKEDIIKRVLPDLNKLSTVQIEKPAITIYKGSVGIRAAAEDMLSAKEILVYGASKNADAVMGSYTSNFAKKRVEKKVKLKAVIEDIPKHMLEKDVKKYTQIQKLNFLRNHNTVYFIYNNKVLICTLKEELMVVQIESPLLVESQKLIFQFLWNQSDN